MSEARKDIETIQKEVIESNPNFMPTRQIDDFDNEATYKMEVEFDKLGMQEFQRKIESGEIQLDKPTQKTLENAYSQYNHLLQKRELLEKDLQGFKAFDDNNILKTNSTLIAQTQRVLHQIQDDISFTKEAIKDIENEIGTSNKALMPLNTHAETKKEIHAFSNLLVPTQTQTKPSFATNPMKQENTQGLIPYNSTQANNALIPYNTPQDTKLLAYNETKLLEYKETLHALQKLDKSFKDFMSMPFSIIVDSKGNALPLTSQAIKNFIFHNLYKEFLNTTKALNKPLAQLDFKPLSNEIKALPYKANANLKAHVRDINAKTNDFLDSMQEFKNTTKEIKLLPYNKPSENKANEVDRFRNVLGDNFTTKPNNDKPITDYQVTMEVEPYVRDLAKLKGSEIYADLQNLVNKHREMFDKPSDVFKLIKEIKKNPEFFYNNNRLDAALIVKRLSDNKIGKMGVKKDDGEVIHATKVREKDLIRLKKVSDKFADSVGIIQTFTQQGSKNDKSLNGLPNNETNPTTKQEISKDIESKSTQDNTQWQQFIHNALPNELKHYEKLSGEQLNKIKEANELDKDIFFSRWHNHPKVLETIKVKTKDNKEVEVLKTLHKDGNIKYYEPLSATEVDINKFKDIDLQTYKQSIIENVGENQTKIFDIVAGMNAKYFNTFEKELLNDIFSHHKNKKGMQKIKDIESKSTTQDIQTAPKEKHNAYDDMQNTQRIAELRNNLFEHTEKWDKLFNTPFEIAQKYHYIKDNIQNFEALPPTLTETKFFENYQGLVSKFLKKNLKVVPSIYDEKGELINLYKLNERVNSFSELEKFKNSLENKSYSALGILMPLKDSKTLDELKEVLTGLNTYLQKQHKKLNKDYVKNYESKKLEAQQARKELDEIETIFKIEADGTLKGYAEAMYNTLESLRNSRNAIVQEILKLDKGLASLKTLENRFEGKEFYSFLEDIISLREKADMSLYEKEKARKRIEEALNINPIKEFGTNYAKHYHSGETAIAKLISEAQAHKGKWS